MPEELETLITALFLLLWRVRRVATRFRFRTSYRYFCLAMLTYGAVWMR